MNENEEKMSASEEKHRELAEKIILVMITNKSILGNKLLLFQIDTSYKQDFRLTH